MTDVFADKSGIDVAAVKTLDGIAIGLPASGLQTPRPEKDSNGSKWRVVRLNPRAIFWSQSKPGSFTLFTCILWGYDGLAGNIVVGIPQFRQDFGVFYQNQWVIPAEWLLGFNGGGMASE
ncbi:MAG: hypothetical protein M1840_008582 [Geoglossum simile]|nr:MAG: hypothetical protein M1840_008582 [Geoglossum simile]